MKGKSQNFMEINFSKMHGCGNDYIYFNCLNDELKNLNLSKLAQKLSNRHFSIGGDGIVLIYKSKIADFKMRMFNVDGSEGKMCGNAIRCVAKFVFDEGLFNGNVLKIETLSGVKTLTVEKQNGLVVKATVDMGPADLNPSKIPVSGNFTEPLINFPLKIDDEIGTFKVTCVSMGNPHCVVFVNDLNKLNLFELGPKFEKNSFFEQGVNTEFVKIKNEVEIDVKVWERGSGLTLACGTGACAATVASILNGFCKLNEKINVNLQGGVLEVCQTNSTVFLTGNSVLAFKGIVKI